MVSGGEKRYTVSAWYGGSNDSGRAWSDSLADRKDGTLSDEEDPFLLVPSGRRVELCGMHGEEASVRKQLCGSVCCRD